MAVCKPGEFLDVCPACKSCAFSVCVSCMSHVCPVCVTCTWLTLNVSLFLIPPTLRFRILGVCIILREGHMLCDRVTVWPVPIRPGFSLLLCNLVWRAIVGPYMWFSAPLPLAEVLTQRRPQPRPLHSWTYLQGVKSVVSLMYPVGVHNLLLAAEMHTVSGQILRDGHFQNGLSIRNTDTLWIKQVLATETEIRQLTKSKWDKQMN